MKRWMLAGTLVCLAGCLGPSLTVIGRGQAKVLDRQGMDTRELELTTDVVVFGVHIPSGSRLHFLNGRMKSIEPARRFEIEGVSFPAGSRVFVKETAREFSFHDWLLLERARLGADEQYGGIPFHAGDTVEFDRHQRPVWALLEGGALELGGRRYGRGSEVSFDLAGEVKHSITAAQRKARLERAARCRMRCAPLEAGGFFANCYDRCTGF